MLISLKMANVYKCDHLPTVAFRLTFQITHSILEDNRAYCNWKKEVLVRLRFKHKKIQNKSNVFVKFQKCVPDA